MAKARSVSRRFGSNLSAPVDTCPGSNRVAFDEQGTMRRFSRAFFVAVVALAGPLLGPSTASALTQVGETFSGATGSCDTGTAL